MGQDIRELLKDHVSEPPSLPDGHEARFADRLDEAFEEKQGKPLMFWLKVAAIAIVALGVGYFGYQQLSNDQSVETIIADSGEEDNTQNSEPQITLGDISPDLKKVEDFYTNGISMQLASLEEDPENKELIEGYKRRLADLDTEYAVLNKELNEVGPTEATITALIENLKLRLELLFKLKNKLDELKKSENEQFENMEA